MLNTKNPECIMDIYCQYKGWKGGTIHQAKRDYDSLSKDEQLKVKILLSVLDDSEQIYTVKWFTS